ncbi:hypothetical protein HMPREF9474_03542 [ [[Clostridium] symbiosum WAL-14163]|uniref:Uncharacterized protein n=1 Tax=Clostridium symbiosum (strain WAL-14163) TaxID=742740 RepID=E7GRJ7_CLOS6|nr:hypothetical protein HMPREF9474_03542 [ [[Clostridium] symbiosum WAL-14163]
MRIVTAAKNVVPDYDVAASDLPADDRVYQFLDRKRSEGKPYLVYMTAGANKFLRIYYGKVKACIAAQSKSE